MICSSSPVVTTTSIIFCFNKHRLTQVHLEGERQKERERERERERDSQRETERERERDSRSGQVPQRYPKKNLYGLVVQDYTGRIPFLSSSQQYQRTEGNIFQPIRNLALVVEANNSTEGCRPFCQPACCRPAALYVALQIPLCSDLRLRTIYNILEPIKLSPTQL